MIQKRIEKKLIEGGLLKFIQGNKLVLADSHNNKIILSVIENGIEKSVSEFDVRFASSISQVYKDYEIIGL